MNSIYNYIQEALIKKNTNLRNLEIYYLVIPYDNVFNELDKEYKNFKVSGYFLDFFIIDNIIEIMNTYKTDIYIYKIPKSYNIPGNITKITDIPTQIIKELKKKVIEPITFRNDEWITRDDNEYISFTEEFEPVFISK